ncbi:MAG: hypothetical protein R3B13_11805 [Polyangiaceae bacterium]
MKQLGRALGLGFALVNTACGSNSAGAPSPSITVPSSSAHEETPHAGSPYRQAVADAVAAAKEKGWLKKDVVEVVPNSAAIVLYEPTAEQAPAPRLTRFDAVAAGGASVSGQSGMVDVAKTKSGGLLWDLRGDGERFVVLQLTTCGASCGQAQPKVLELTPKGFSDAGTAPVCPTCISDHDHDHVPEFTYPMLTLKVAPCSRASCGPSYALQVDVRGYESWESGRFDRELRDFIPLYFDLLRKTKRDAERVRRAANKQAICPLNALRVAAESYVYGRLIGEGEADALKAADQLMSGYSMGPCEKEYDLLAPARSWGELRADLRAMQLPALQRYRARKPGPG